MSQRATAETIGLPLFGASVEVKRNASTSNIPPILEALTYGQYTFNINSHF